MNRYRNELPIVDFELSYVQDGKKVKVSGKAKGKMDTRSTYEDIYYDSLSPIATVPTSNEASIMLDLVMSDGKLYTIKTIDEAKQMEKIERTITVSVPDRTFESLSTARKRAGVPKTAIFEFVSRNSTEYIYAKDSAVKFTWEDVIV